MIRLLSTTGFIIGAVLAAAPAQARTYDCSKPGNANKAACKDTAKVSPGPAPTPTASTTSAPAVTAPPKRNYDCSKAGNANKAACKTAATTAAAPVAAARPVPVPAAAAARAPAVLPAATPAAAVVPTAATGRAAGPAVISPTGARIVPWTTKTGKLVHYDCSKAGNQTKQACKQ